MSRDKGSQLLIETACVTSREGTPGYLMAATCLQKKQRDACDAAYDIRTPQTFPRPRAFLSACKLLPSTCFSSLCFCLEHSI